MPATIFPNLVRRHLY